LGVDMDVCALESKKDKTIRQVQMALQLPPLAERLIRAQPLNPFEVFIFKVLPKYERPRNSGQ
jgi:hypothetical protein